MKTCYRFLTALFTGFASVFALFPGHATPTFRSSSIANRMHHNFVRVGDNLRKAYQGEMREQEATQAKAEDTRKAHA
ncbi:MAG TPA: hypothetical protein VFK31_06465 [Rhodanobacteraceae bacterium]|nr:hypothetical protein [Rhodanobacteraceae bacterium]